MSRYSVRYLILRALQHQSGLSNPRLRADTGAGDDAYDRAKTDLVSEGLAEVYAGQGGSLRLTDAGKRHAKKEVEPEGESAVDHERELYAPLVDAIQKDAAQLGRERILVRDVGAARNRGMWSNPDVLQIAVETYPRLRKTELVVSTFELKKWGGATVASVFEAAAQSRFAHRSYVVLEWAESVTFSLDSDANNLDQIVRECGRFGIGLWTMQPFRNGWRYTEHLKAAPRVPADSEVNAFLEDYFLRYPDDAAQYDKWFPSP